MLDHPVFLFAVWLLRLLAKHTTLLFVQHSLCSCCYYCVRLSLRRITLASPLFDLDRSWFYLYYDYFSSMLLVLCPYPTPTSLPCRHNVFRIPSGSAIPQAARQPPTLVICTSFDLFILRRMGQLQLKLYIHPHFTVDIYRCICRRSHYCCRGLQQREYVGSLRFDTLCRTWFGEIANRGCANYSTSPASPISAAFNQHPFPMQFL